MCGEGYAGQCVYESDRCGGELVWAGICHDVHIQLQIVQGTLNAVKYRYDLLGLIVLPFLEQHLHMKYISDDTIFQSL